MTTHDIDFRTALTDNRLLGLWRMMRGLRRRYLAAVLALSLGVMAKTATFLLIAYLVDEVIVTGDLARLPWVALGFVGLAALEGGFTFLSGRLAAHTAETVARRLRNYLFDHIQRLTFAYHDKMPTGELLQRATSDVEAVRRFFADQALGVGRIALLFVVNLTAIVFLHWPLALLSIIVVPFIVGVSLFFFKRVSQMYEHYQDQDAALSTTLQENLSGVRVVKAFARQNYEMEKFERDNAEKYRRGKKLTWMHSLFWPITDVLCSAQTLGGYFAGALMVLDGTLTLGQYLGYMGWVVQLIWPMREMGRLITQSSTALVSYTRLVEVLREAQEPLDAGTHRPAILRGEIAFNQVNFDYAGETRVLRDITFSVQPGQVVALLGPTGSGKTSLVNLLPRFYPYTSGSITLDGVELTEYPREYLRQHIGVVEQQAFLFSRTIRENITYGVGRAVSEAEVIAAAQAAAIHETILSFPNGYDTLVGEKGITLSGGQKQRVAMARTLLKDPRILILDDSTSAVDAETEAAIRQALEQLMRGRTTFIIAHRIQSVMNADLILVLEHGRITQRGTHAELLAQEGLYRRIYDLQARIEDEVTEEIALADSPAVTAPLKLALSLN